MNLYEKIVKDQLIARKENNELLIENLGMIINKFDNLIKEMGKQLTNDDCLIILRETYYNIIDCNSKYELENNENIKIILKKIESYFKIFDYDINDYHNLFLSNKLTYDEHKKQQDKLMDS